MSSTKPQIKHFKDLPSIRHTDYTTVSMDQKLAELVPPAVADEVHDLLDSMFALFAVTYEKELIDRGWIQPEGDAIPQPRYP